MSGGNASTPGLADRLATLSTPVVAGFLFVFFVVVFVVGEVVIAMAFGARQASLETAVLHGATFGLLFAIVAALARGGAGDSRSGS